MPWILGKYLDGDFRICPMAETPVSPAQIEAIGRQFGVGYPAELAAHICGRFPGVYVEVKEELWPRTKPFDVGPFWSFLYAVHTFTSAPGSEEWMRLDGAAASFRQRSGLAAAPILKIVGDADVYCVDAGAQILRYDHELNELTPANKSFWEIFEYEIAELAARKERKKALGSPAGSLAT